MDLDIIIVGAGPAGLCLARALRPTGLRVMLLEQQPETSLAEPAFDGREIALTHHSRQLMAELGLWSHIDPAHISPLKDALVLDGKPGPTQARMRISHDDARHQPGELGYLISNQHIRRAAFLAAMVDGEDDSFGPPPALRCNAKVSAVQVTAEKATVTLDSSEALTARLLVAADSRHSSTRRSMGISADLHDYGRTMLVCAMTHEQDHEHTAWEWFDHGQTLALLPMNPCPETGLHRSSVVLTLPHQDIEALLQTDELAFNTEMGGRFAHQLGNMRLVSTRHAYPLVGVWPHRLVSTRFAAVGDAAVGMHPVTAHGFNLGLRSIEALSEIIRRQVACTQDIADTSALQRYQRTHQSASRGIYMATHALAMLYTRDVGPARVLRQALIGLGERLPPFKRAVAASLTGLH
ncbi:5-demethoxyubiquinol-8 5-hydroxylase UbiM [Hydrogenophaga sp. 5NK40-0174]|uniref:5-demethoxyubiquinol-8 5-hydroxylase UbiM n=1 Tax=Hydrogenophaga sp. 5NK40-0174 TaxID=3127649 RepID=UPI003104A5E5